MPAFTFEKISPPARRVSASSPAAEKKPRSVVVQMLDRFVGTRAKRKAGAGKASQPKQRKPSK